MEVKATGVVNLELFRDGKLINSITVPNLVVNSGKEYIASRATSSGNLMSHMAIGTSNVAAAPGQNILQAELARVAFDSAPTNEGNIMKFVATFGQTVGTTTLNITEAAIFDASSGGNMLCRTTFAGFPKGAADSLTISWNITIN